MTIEFNGERITDDSRDCDKNSIFFLNNQNKKYKNEVIKKGYKSFIQTDELIKRFGIGDLKIVGITGTNGKTTTAAAIYSILLDLDKKVALQGTRGVFVNGEKVRKYTLTTPSIFNTLINMKKAKESGCEYFIMEVSSHAIDQKRIEGLEFALKVFTNISQDHLDYHKSMDEYKRVKSSFFQDDSKKLINKDGGKISFNKKNAFTYSLEYPATYKIEAYKLQPSIEAVLRKIDKFFSFESPMIGLFNLYNLTAAIASVDIICDEDLDTICKTVENFAGVKGRVEIVREDPLVIVDFAHTPDGMQKVLETVKDRDISVVFGAGGERDKGKRAKMGKIASLYAKKIYITNDNPRYENPDEIINDILSGVDEKLDVLIIPDRKKAISIALKRQEKDEALFVLGKGDEEYQEIKGEKIPFSDRDIILSLI